MADSASELESDTSSIDGGPTSKMSRPMQIEQLQKRIESLQQQNAVLKEEVETWKMKYRNLQEENKELRKASVSIQARAEQEEEFISNTLLKKIQELRREKEKLAMNYEQEEECLTNDLSRKLTQLRQEKIELEQNLAREQEHQIAKLKRRIEKLEAETHSKQFTLEKLKVEKVELENSLEQEQEALVNKLWKKMNKLETEKRLLQEKLDQPVSSPSSPRDLHVADGDMAGNLSHSIQSLQGEVTSLRNQLTAAQSEHKQKMEKLVAEEHKIREENLRLQRKLQLEVERREQLCRHLSESESSLEMDDERHYNEMAKQQEKLAAAAAAAVRPRTVSSPIPMTSPGQSRPISPGLHHSHIGNTAFSPPSPMRCGGAGTSGAGAAVAMHSVPCNVPMGGHNIHNMAGHSLPPTQGAATFLPSTSPLHMFDPHHPAHPHQHNAAAASIVKVRTSPDKFVKPTAPPPPKSPSPISGAPPSPGGPMQVSQSLPDRAQSPMQVDRQHHQSKP